MDMLGLNRRGAGSLVACGFEKDYFLCKSSLGLDMVCKLVPELLLVQENSAYTRRAPLVGERYGKKKEKRRAGVGEKGGGARVEGGAGRGGGGRCCMVRQD